MGHGNPLNTKYVTATDVLPKLLTYLIGDQQLLVLSRTDELARLVIAQHDAVVQIAHPKDETATEPNDKRVNPSQKSNSKRTR